MKFLILIPLLSMFNSYAGDVELKLTSGEVKILYPCSILDTLPKDKEEKESLTFYEKGKSDLYDRGLILRQKKNKNEMSLKYRPHNDSIVVDENMYSELRDSKDGELKCELDVTYHETRPQFVSSCAFSAEGSDLIQEHQDFLEMVHLPEPNLDNLRSVEVDVTKWKLKVAHINNAPIKKKIFVEVWKFRNECILEVSGKFDGLGKAVPALKYLKDLVKATPSAVQGNKTGIALGIHAMKSL